MSKCLWRGGSVREELGLSSPFPCYPVIQECQMKENLDRKKILCLIDLCVLDDFCIFLWLHIFYRTYLFILLTLRYIMFFNYFSILDDFTIFFWSHICHRTDWYVLLTLRNTIFLIIDFLDTSILVYFDIFSYNNYTYSFKIDWLVLFVIRDEVLFLDFKRPFAKFIPKKKIWKLTCADSYSPKKAWSSIVKKRLIFQPDILSQ